MKGAYYICIAFHDTKLTNIFNISHKNKCTCTRTQVMQTLAPLHFISFQATEDKIQKNNTLF